MALLAATEEVVTTMPQALVNTGLGMGTVFIVLILISLIIYLLKFVPDLLDRKSKQPESPAPAPAASAPAQSAPAPVVENKTDDTQLVAVITAAIAASMEQEGTPIPADALVIRSIKKRY